MFSATNPPKTEFIYGQILTDKAEGLKRSWDSSYPQRKQHKSSFRNSYKRYTQYTMGMGDDGLQPVMDYVKKSCGPERNDTSTFSCFMDSRNRWFTGVQSIIEANATVLVIARAYLGDEDAWKFEQEIIIQKFPLQSFRTPGSNWGAGGYTGINNIRKYQRIMIQHKCAALKNMNQDGIYYEAEREVENLYKDEIINRAKIIYQQTGNNNSHDNYLSARTEVLNLHKDEIIRKARNLWEIINSHNDQALYYRALEGLNLTCVTNDSVNSVKAELISRTPIPRQQILDY